MKAFFRSFAVGFMWMGTLTVVVTVLSIAVFALLAGRPEGSGDTSIETHHLPVSLPDAASVSAIADTDNGAVDATNETNETKTEIKRESAFRVSLPTEWEIAKFRRRIRKLNHAGVSLQRLKFDRYIVQLRVGQWWNEQTSDDRFAITKQIQIIWENCCRDENRNLARVELFDAHGKTIVCSSWEVMEWEVKTQIAGEMDDDRRQSALVLILVAVAEERVGQR